MQCVQAAQITFEDYFMADLHIQPLKIVGYEGVFGSLAMILVLLPLVSLVKAHDGDGLHENSLDTLHVSTSYNPDSDQQCYFGLPPPPPPGACPTCVTSSCPPNAPSCWHEESFPPAPECASSHAQCFLFLKMLCASIRPLSALPGSSGMRVKGHFM